MNIYSNMKEKAMKDKEKNRVREEIYLTQLVNANSGIFNHDIEQNADLDIPLGTIEKILITNGSVAFFKDVSVTACNDSCTDIKDFSETFLC